MIKLNGPRMTNKSTSAQFSLTTTLQTWAEQPSTISSITLAVIDPTCTSTGASYIFFLDLENERIFLVPMIA